MYFFTIYLGCLLAIILLAVVAYLFVELPFLNAEKLIFSNQTSKKDDNVQNMEALEGIYCSTKIYAIPNFFIYFTAGKKVES